MDLRALLARLADRLGIPNHPARSLVIAALVALIAGGSIVLAVDTDGDGQPDHTTTVDVPSLLDRLPPEQELRERLERDTGRYDAATVEAASQLVEEGEPRKEPGDNEQAASVLGDLQAIERLAGRERAAEVPGCRPMFLTVNWSSRSGVIPRWKQWHYAVIPNMPGFGDLFLLHRIFANDARDASSHFGVDGEGNCIQMVPMDGKSWVAVNSNPHVVSTEIIARGDEPDLCPEACERTVRRISRAVKARYGIPIRHGGLSSSNPCFPTRSGHVTHWQHGACAGSHHDIKPFSIDAFVRMLADDNQALTDKELKWVKSARRPTGTGHSRRYWCQRIRDRIEALERPAPGRDRAPRRRILRRVARATC